MDRAGVEINVNTLVYESLVDQGFNIDSVCVTGPHAATVSVYIGAGGNHVSFDAKLYKLNIFWLYSGSDTGTQKDLIVKHAVEDAKKKIESIVDELNMHEALE